MKQDDLSYKNLKIQKQFLSNISQLYQKPPYQNKGAEKTLRKQKQLVEDIINQRRILNPYFVFDEMLYVLKRLGLISESKADHIMDYMDTMDLVSMFGDAIHSNPYEP